MVPDKMEPVALAVKLKGFAKSTQDFASDILDNFGFSRRRHPIEILKRLQREAFSDIMKLRDRQDKVERLLSIKSSKTSPFDVASTRVRGEVEASGLLLMINRISEENQDAITRTGVKTGINSRFTFETTIRDKDTLTAEFVATMKGQFDALASPLSLAKVIYAANINDWCSLIAVPLGAKYSDVWPSRSSHQLQEHDLDGNSFTGPPLLNQHIGSGISLMVKKSKIIASVAQFAYVNGIPYDSPQTNHCLSTLGQVIYNLSWRTKLSLLGLHKISTSSNQNGSLDPIALPIGMFRPHKGALEALDDSFGYTALVLQSDLDSSTKVGGWVEMNNLDPRHLQWGMSISDLLEDDFGWGLTLGGLVKGSNKWEHYQVEAFSKIKFGEKFSLRPSVMYVKDGNTRFPALMMKSNWSF